MRHSFVSLVLHEVRSVIYVARRVGHGAALTPDVSTHMIDESWSSRARTPRARSSLLARVELPASCP